MREKLLDALRAAGGNETKAAALLGVNRSTLYRQMPAFSITF